MSEKVAFFELDGFGLHGLDFLQILFVVKTISKNVAECTESTF